MGWSYIMFGQSVIQMYMICSRARGLSPGHGPIISNKKNLSGIVKYINIIYVKSLQVCYGPPQVAGVRWQVLGGRWQVLGGRRQVLGVRCSVLFSIYSAFQIDALHRYNQNLVGTLHATSLLFPMSLLWSTDMKTAVKIRVPIIEAFWHSPLTIV